MITTLHAPSALPGEFLRIGGVLTGDDLALALRSSIDQPVSRVAQWIAQRRVVNFVWQAQLLLPTFQFEPVSMRPRSTVGDVIAELADVYDDWDIAAWFARPNAWLADEAPARLIATDPCEVVRAARADRFVVNG
jgi:hypothetical protein